MKLCDRGGMVDAPTLYVDDRLATVPDREETNIC